MDSCTQKGVSNVRVLYYGHPNWEVQNVLKSRYFTNGKYNRKSYVHTISEICLPITKSIKTRKNIEKVFSSAM